MTPQSNRLVELFSARLSCAVDDDVAGVVLGPRLYRLFIALGVPERDWWHVSRLCDRLPDAEAIEILGSYVDVLVAERCRLRRDDLIGDLIDYEIGGRGLTADEIRAVVVELLRV